MVVAAVLIAGDHVPVMPLFDVVGKVKLPPLQIAASCVKLGVSVWFTVTLSVVTVANCPAIGVKVYTDVPALEVLMTEGFHVP